MEKHRKELARTMRSEGESIKVIAKRVGAAQSTASLWVRDIQLTPSQIKSLQSRWHAPEVIEKRRMSRIKNEATKRQIAIDEASRQIDAITIDELRLIGTALYWAEGGKTQRMVRFSNGDPDMIRLMMRYFQEVCGVDSSRFRGHIHIHQTLDSQVAEAYWQAITKIPANQFYKTYNKPNISSKSIRKTLPYGVCDIYILDIKLFLKISGWIDGIRAKTLSDPS